jgi:hypothetical protein
LGVFLLVIGADVDQGSGWAAYSERFAQSSFAGFQERNRTTMSLKGRWLDLGFVTALLVLATVPVILLRDCRLLWQGAGLLGWLALLGGMLPLWCFLARRSDQAEGRSGPAIHTQEEGRREVWWTLLVALLLAGVAVTCFFTPLRIHFWSGCDEFLNLIADARPGHFHDWLTYADAIQVGANRPLILLPCAVGQALTPDRIEGFLLLAVCLCWGNSLMLFCLLRETLPQARLLPIVAAVLLIVDRSESSRFLVMFTSNYYWTALVLLLGGLWLFLRSYRSGSRPLLALSCLLLGGSLLMYEAAYPLAPLALVLAWFKREQRRRLPVWGGAWVGTLALLATRFLLFLLHRGGQSYQAAQSVGALRDPGLLLGNLGLRLRTALGQFHMTGAALVHWKSAGWALVLVLLLVGLAVWRAAGTEALPRRRYLVALGVSAVAMLLGLLPFLHISQAFRTQFFAVPAQSVLLACLLCLVGGLLGRRAGGAAVAVCLALLAANATAEAISEQEHARACSVVNFERTVRIFRQLHAVLGPSPGILVVLLPDDPARSALDLNYACLPLARHLLGVSVVQEGRDRHTDPVFHRDAVSVRLFDNLEGFHPRVGYEKVLAFRLSLDGTLHLLHRLPRRLLPPGCSAAAYDPLTLLKPGPVQELPYFRYPAWADRLPDLFHMADGVVLGSGWGPLESHDGKPSRRVCREAELIVNSLGQRQRELRLQVEGSRAGRLEALDRQGKIVTTVPLEQGCQEVCLMVPTDPDRVSLVRVRVRSDAGEAVPFRVFCPAGKMPRFPLPSSAPDIVVPEDVELGRNWHHLESYTGQPFRWVDNDGELVLATPPVGGHLVVDVEPGPSMAGQPCRLTLRDETDRVLASACFRTRQELRLPLPTNLGPDAAVLRLHVEGGGASVPNDPRIMNFRVLRCSCTAD